MLPSYKAACDSQLIAIKDSFTFHKIKSLKCFVLLERRQILPFHRTIVVLDLTAAYSAAAAHLGIMDERSRWRCPLVRVRFCGVWLNKDCCECYDLLDLMQQVLNSTLPLDLEISPTCATTARKKKDLRADKAAASPGHCQLTTKRGSQKPNSLRCTLRWFASKTSSNKVFRAYATEEDRMPITQLLTRI
jgi:hypothetical protein